MAPAMLRLRFRGGLYLGGSHFSGHYALFGFGACAGTGVGKPRKKD